MINWIIAITVINGLLFYYVMKRYDRGIKLEKNRAAYYQEQRADDEYVRYEMGLALKEECGYDPEFDNYINDDMDDDDELY